MAEEPPHKDVVIGQFTRQAEGYARLIGAMSGSDRQSAFRAIVDARPDDTMLDVCCGPGTLALDLAPFVSKVTGFDVTPAMLVQARAAQARAAQAKRDVDNVEWRQGDVYALPFEAASFSLVTCAAAFHHITDPRAAFQELVRVCRPGGRIVIRDVTPAAQKSAAYDRMEKLRDPSHIHALTPWELARLGEGSAVSAPVLRPGIAADLALDGILAASFPEVCTIAEIRAMFLEDALSGEDLLGFNARLLDGEIRVSFPQTTAKWIRC